MSCESHFIPVTIMPLLIKFYYICQAGLKYTRDDGEKNLCLACARIEEENIIVLDIVLRVAMEMEEFSTGI